MHRSRTALAAAGAIALAAGCSALGNQANGLTGTVPQTASARIAAAAAPVVGGCQIFPTPPPNGPSGNDWWNTDVSGYPVDPKSDAYIATIPGNLHPDFGHEYFYGIPYNVVPSTQPKVPVSFDYTSESNPGPYPIPPDAQIEGGKHSNGDRHVLVLQQGTCKLYEMWRAFPKNNGAKWHAGSGAIFDLSSNALRPNGWTSADAAGLPIMPGLINCSEVAAGAINHAIRFTVNNTQRGYIHPATHFASSSSNPNLPPMGLRVRLKASFDISKFNRVSKIILTAMKTYGMLLADNGSNWYFQGQGGSAAKCWNDNELDQLKTVPGTAFEVVQTGPILH